MTNFIKSTDIIYKDVTKNIHYEKGNKQKTVFGGIITLCGVVGIITVALYKLMVLVGYKDP